MVVVLDNSTNGTWVRVLCSRTPSFPQSPKATRVLTRVRAHTHLRSHSHAQINGVRVDKGQSRILRDGNEIAFGSPMQQQNPAEDYRFIYRHLAPVELTGIHAHYDMAHELGRGTFATVMKAMARDTGEWWAVKIIHAQKLRGNNNNEHGGEQNNQSNSNQLANLAREVGILETLNHPNICRLRETFVPEQGGHDFCENFISIKFCGVLRVD
jgi:hypothetical protein